MLARVIKCSETRLAASEIRKHIVLANEYGFYDCPRKAKFQYNHSASQRKCCLSSLRYAVLKMYEKNQPDGNKDYIPKQHNWSTFEDVK